MIPFLIAHHAELNLEDRWGWTPTDYVFSDLHQYTRIITILALSI